MQTSVVLVVHKWNPTIYYKHLFTTNKSVHERKGLHVCYMCVI